MSGWQDSNLRPPAPKAGAIPGYATPRNWHHLFISGTKRALATFLQLIDFVYFSSNRASTHLKSGGANIEEIPARSK